MTEHNPFDLVGQQEKKAELEKQAEIQYKIKVDDLKWIMGNRRGRRFVWRILERAGIYRTTFTGNSNGFFLEGKRELGLTIVQDIHQACPELYFEMIKEAKDANKPSK